MKNRMIVAWLFALLGITLLIPPCVNAEKLIVLTFDDGPRPKYLYGHDGNAGLIDVLQSNNVPAHFFVVGGDARVNKEVLKDLYRREFRIENHTYGHDDLRKLFVKSGASAVLTSIERTTAVIEEATGKKPDYIRPPYWSINQELKKLITLHGLRVLDIGDPDINSLDYDDFAKHKNPEELVSRVKGYIASREKRGVTKHVLVFHELPNSVRALQTLIPYFKSKGYRFGYLDDYFKKFLSKNDNQKSMFLPVNFTESDVRAISTGQTDASHKPGDINGIRAVYLSIDYLHDKSKIDYIENLVDSTELNAVIIDFKVSRPENNEYMKSLVDRFKRKNIYLIARVVVFQDSYFAKAHPGLAIKNHDGGFWFSGRKAWARYWLDPASTEVLDYNVQVAKMAIDIGFDEVNFDYIRFPTDGNLHDIVYPKWNGVEQKSKVMRRFFEKLTGELRHYNSSTVLSIDIFGEVFARGVEPGIGQKLTDLGDLFDVISPMAYPSHYMCGEFGVHDPNAYPYLVYKKTLEPGLKILKETHSGAVVRPWVQDFSIRNIFGCGPAIKYGVENVSAEIKAGKDLGVNGYMLWNASNRYTSGALYKK